MGWLFVGACVAFAVYYVAASAADEARKQKAAAEAAARHHRFCLVARYPQPQDAAGFPWCTCAWKTARRS